MAEKISEDKKDFITGYMDKLQQQLDEYERGLDLGGDENAILGTVREVINVLGSEIPELESSVLFRNGTTVQDARVTIGLLKKYLIDNGFSVKTENKTNIDKFWTSFVTYFEHELPYKDYLKDMYVRYDGWNGGTYYPDIDYDQQFRLHYGVSYNEEMFKAITNIKRFIELSFAEWIKPDKRYEYTKDINGLFRKFKLPYKLSKGKVISSSYKTTNIDDKIINYSMLERKIQFAEEMIMSNETLDKKVALDYIVDSLQYLVSIQRGKTVKEKYSNSAKIICGDDKSKQYIVIRNELDEIMKVANVFFDIRHNEYLNVMNEKREALGNPIFIEYLYNRIYSLVYILKLKAAVGGNL